MFTKNISSFFSEIEAVPKTGWKGFLSLWSLEVLKYIDQKHFREVFIPAHLIWSPRIPNVARALLYSGAGIIKLRYHDWQHQQKYPALNCN